MTQDREQSASANYRTRLSRIESRGDLKEREIQKLEKVEAELLDRIKQTQSVHAKHYKELEEALYKQQFSVE